MRFETSTQISASPKTVWAILTDLPRWTDWNTTIEAIEGTAGLGDKVKVSVKANPGRAFPLTVTALEPGERMVWTGGMPLGLFKGVRTFNVSEQDGGTGFHMVEDYSGLMSGPITKRIPDLQPSFDEFAACLKAEAERRDSVG